ncbi:MAG: diguanylate cyclase [Rhodospirillaceae bacterium]
MNLAADSKGGLRAERAERLIYLIYSDDVEAASLAAEIGCFGYNVRVFSNTVEAREIFRETPPTAAVMVLDLLANGIGAVELADVTHETFPVLFISGQDDLVARLQAVRSRGAGFFAKPVDVPLLVDVLDRLMVQRSREAERILIVDDDRIQANLNGLHLRRAGMDVKILIDPMATIEVLSQFQPDLVLLDMYMPLCTGMELATVIRQMEAFVSLPIVFLSAETDRDKQLAAVGLGGDDFLVKPIKPEHLVSAVVSRTERSRKLRSVMMRDSLTGLLNHSTITDRLNMEACRAAREGGALSAVMIDIDHFKQVNDSFGHPVGDRVIKSLSRLMTQRLRCTDIVGRYGGEEFMIILPGTAPEQAVELVEQLRQVFSILRHHSSDNGASSCSSPGADPVDFSVTFSAGVAGFSVGTERAELKEAADLALYEAKRQGRNRVVVAP